MHDRNEDACPEYFCRLGCICDSLARENRGPTHCRRVECMFDCSCFKHKVILRHPPNVTNAQRGRKRSVLAFCKSSCVTQQFHTLLLLHVSCTDAQLVFIIWLKLESLWEKCSENVCFVRKRIRFTHG